MSKRKKRKTNTTIFIACEGRKTEPIYFENINEEVEDEGGIVITIYPDQNVENPKTNAIGLVEEAQSRMDDFDEVWVVFDKNGYTKHKAAFELAATPINGKIVNIGFSSISFEHWVLLHFEKNSNAFTKSADVISYLVDNNLFAQYEKNTNIYSTLKNKTKTAIENTAWLKRQMESELLANDNLIYTINPYTNIDNLVKRLFGITIDYFVLEFDNLYHHPTGKFELLVTKDETEFDITLSNKTNNTILFNTPNLSNHFQLFDVNENVVEISIDRTISIASQQRENFKITSIENIEHGKFSFLINNETVLIFF